jgi:hypothetical protein
MNMYRIVSEIHYDYNFSANYPIIYFYISNNCKLISDIIFNNIRINTPNADIFQFHLTRETELNYTYSIEFAHGFYLKYMNL